MALSRAEQVSLSQWERAKEIFETAISLESYARHSYLIEACADDSALFNEVKELLDYHEQATSFLQYPSRSLTYDIPAEPVFSIGELVANRFRIMRLIGHGGMGEVYVAYDLELGELVALKTLRPAMLNDARMITSFKQEVHLARRVTHRNVCRIFDLFWHQSGSGEPIAVLSMEYLAGETLLERIRKCGPFPLSSALPIIRQIAEGLDAAHQFGIVHGDFKSSNVMLVPQPHGDIRAFITDFGLARDQQSTSDPSKDGEILGTPAYLAPEQLHRDGLTSAADIYALGVILFEMVTGHLPFEGSAETLVALKQRQPEPPSPRQYTSELDADWEAAILKCLNSDPAQRPASALDVCRRLDVSGGPSRRWFIVTLIFATASAIPILRSLQSKQRSGTTSSASFKRAQEFAKRRTREGLENAVTEYRQAVQSQPNDAEVWIGLADAYSAMANFQFMEPGKALSAAREAAEQAVRIDSTSGRARGVLAYCMSINLREWLKAETYFEQAVRLAPSDAEVRLWYGAHLTRLGRYEEATAQLRAGLDQDPVSLTLNEQLATVYFLAGHKQEFEHLAKELIRLHPFEATAYLTLARALEEQGQYKEALENCQEADKYRHSEGALCVRGSIEASQGHREGALVIAQQVEKYWEQNPFESLLLGALYAKLGDNAKAVDVLLKGCQRNDSSVLLAPKHPYLVSIHSEPKYTEFLKCIGLQH